MSAMLDVALEYIRKGWSIMPIAAGTKKPPAGLSWKALQSRRIDETQAKHWWGTKYKDAGIAIITGKISGLVVIDVDPKHGGTTDGLPHCDMVVNTGGGGWHYYYVMPDEGYGNLQDGPIGRDVRGDGGYVIAPPTIHESGNAYEWELDDKPSPITVAQLIEHCPRSSVEKKEPSETYTNGAAPISKTFVSDAIRDGFNEGGRNGGIARLVGCLIRMGQPADVCEAMCQNVAKICTPPLPPHETRGIVRSIYKAEGKKVSLKKLPLLEGEPEEKGDGSKLNLQEFDDFCFQYGGQTTEWLVPGFIPKKTVAFLAGPPGSYKTWVEFDLAVSLATGLPFLNREDCVPKTKGKVIIFQQEDANESIAERISTIYMAKLGVLQPKIVDGVLTMPVVPKLNMKMFKERTFRFDSPQWVAKLEKTIEEEEPLAVFFDPLYSMVSLEDNMILACQDMQCLKVLRDKYGTSFFVVHHTRKSSVGSFERESMHGSQFLNAFLETMLQLRNVRGRDGSAVLSRRTKASGKRPDMLLNFDIFDGSKADPGEWRYMTSLRELKQEESDQILDPERGDGELPSCLTEIEPAEESMMERISAPGGMRFEQLKSKDDIDVARALVEKKHILFDTDTETFTIPLTL